MTRNPQRLTIAAASLMLLTASCQKDELTVVSTATMHTCAKTTVQVNVDSLVDCGPGWPELHYTICECDTIAFVPVNIQFPWTFQHWTIDQGEDNVDQYEQVLDTITIASELWLDVEYEQGPPPHEHVHIRIDVDTEPCE
jgi:hypothetical protein